MRKYSDWLEKKTISTTSAATSPRPSAAERADAGRARRRGPCARPRPRGAGRAGSVAHAATPVMSSCMRAIACSGGRPRGPQLAGEPALAQHDHAIADVQDVGEAVADQQDRHAARAQARDEVEQPADLLRRQRRGRLVEQQHARAELERARDRHELALAAGQVAHRPAGRPGRRCRARASLGRLARHAPAVEQRDRPEPPARLAAQEDVRRDVEVVAEREVLVDDLDARGAGVERRCRTRRARRPAASSPDGRREDAAEHLDQRRLAGAVVADQADGLRRVERRRRRRRSASMGPKRRPTPSSSSSASLRVEPR